MQYMFGLTREFSGDLSRFDTSSVADMKFMFTNSKFNGDISRWEVSKVTNMQAIFHSNSVFNSDISGWGKCRLQSIFAVYKILTLHRCKQRGRSILCFLQCGEF